MFKILVADPIADEGIEILKKQKDTEVDVRFKLKPEEIISIIGDYDALVVRSETKATAPILDAAKKLKVIGRAGVGVDNVDVPFASKKGIIVMNTPDGNTISTAEHTIAMMMSLSRNIPAADASMKQKKWDRKKFTGVELYGKVLGIIGLGRVGREVAFRAKSFHMEIMAFDPYLTEEMAMKAGFKKATVDEIVTAADYITVHTPLTKETKGIIGEKEIAKMKEGVRLINCARGGIIEEKALVLGLKSGKIAGAAIDVYEKEPPENYIYSDLPNTVLTPHLGASTEEAQVSVAIAIANQVLEALRGGTVRNAVNAPAVPAEILILMKPYILLGETLGRTLVQLVEGPIKNIEIEYTGQVCDFNTSYLTLSIVRGVLSPIVKEPVNFVNAPHILKEKNILVSEFKSNVIKEYTSFIKVALTTDKERISIGGTVFGKNNIRISRLLGYDIDLEPATYMLIIINKDVPGMVGKIGTLLGKENINIASLQMARKITGGDATTILTLDNQVEERIISDLAKMENIRGVKFVKNDIA
ncbi:MAG: phosphoglycerate dehydrogenase [Candidatus Firestonebacteria bacterium]